jgi:hypothetical protein
MPTLRAQGFALFFILAVLSASGCSMSWSVGKSSDSLGAFSDSVSSISESSSPKEDTDKEKASYRDDVANLTNSIAGTSLPANEFPVALARTARQFNITDWAREKETYLGIGKGLKKAGIPKENIRGQAFLRNVLAGNKDGLKYIEEGYRY